MSAHGTGRRREFYIVSEMHGKVLDVKGSNPSPGTELVMYKLLHPPANNQLWYLDPNNGCLRSALNNMTFGSPEKGEALRMEPPSGNPQTEWRLDGMKIINGAGQVLDIKGASKSDSANLCAYDYKSAPNQHWHTQREFHIVSEMNGKVLDIKKADANVGAPVIMYTKKTPASINQLWYYNTEGHILSALNDLVFFCPNKGKGLTMELYNSSDPRHQWKVDGNKILNGLKECLDIRGKNEKDGAELCAYDFKNEKNQLWKIEYA